MKIQSYYTCLFPLQSVSLYFNFVYFLVAWNDNISDQDLKEVRCIFGENVNFDAERATLGLVNGLRGATEKG